MAVSDWDRRELCPDGNCTGLIGPEGTCKVCGRVAPNWGDERKRGTIEDGSDDDDAEDDEDEDDVPDPVKPATKVEIGGGAWTARTLCSDGSCVGVIGADGLCKVCGKPGEAGVAPADDGDEEDDDDELAEDEEWAYEEDDPELAAAAADLAGVASTDEVASAKQVATAAAAAEDEDEDNRALCPDGACIGVIGDDGKCKVCGKEAAA